MMRASRLLAIALIAACGESGAPLTDAGVKNDLGFEPFDGAIRLDSGTEVDASEDAGEDGGQDAGEADATPDAGPENQRGDLIVSELEVLGAEWIELYNASIAAIELTEATLVTNGGTFVLRAPSDPNGVAGTMVMIAPGEHLLGHPNPADASQIPASADFVYGAPGGASNAFGDLRDDVNVRRRGALEDRVDYGGFPLVMGRATQLSNDALDAADNDDAGSWCVPIFREPTPGGANSSCRELSISEVTYDGAPEFIELAGPGGASLDGISLQVGTTTVALAGSTSLDGFHLVDNVALDDDSSSIRIVRNQVVLDAFAWGGASGEGRAVPDLSTEAHAANWARADDETDTGDNLADFHHDPSPTPGARNGATSFAVTRIDPDDAISGVEARIRFEGTDFTDAMTVTIGADVLTSCSFLAANRLECSASGAPGRADVTIAARPELGASVTLNGAFTWTRSNNETDAPAECDYCILQWPQTMTANAGSTSGFIFGRIYEAGVTDVTAGESTQILAELGYGPAGSDPSSSNAWVWVPAIFNVEYGNDDEYMQRLTTPAAGAYLYTYRWSIDGGLTWSYSDADGAGYNPNLSFDAESLGALTVN